MSTPHPPSMERRLASSRGGRIGGKARAESLSPERRKEIAKLAAAKRWSVKREELSSTAHK